MKSLNVFIFEIDIAFIEVLLHQIVSFCYKQNILQNSRWFKFKLHIKILSDILAKDSDIQVNIYSKIQSLGRVIC